MSDSRRHGVGRRRLRRAVAGLRGDSGSVSVEAALVMGVIAVASAILLGGVGVVVAQVRCIDAAREAARLVARGDPARAESAAHELAPSGAMIAVNVAGDEVIVEVSAEPVAGLLPGLVVRAEAMSVLEPGVAGAP